MNARTIIEDRGYNPDELDELRELDQPYPTVDEIIDLVREQHGSVNFRRFRRTGNPLFDPDLMSAEGRRVLLEVPYVHVSGIWLTAYGKDNQVQALGGPGSWAIGRLLDKRHELENLKTELGTRLGEDIRDDFERQADLVADEMTDEFKLRAREAVLAGLDDEFGSAACTDEDLPILFPVADRLARRMWDRGVR